MLWHDPKPELKIARDPVKKSCFCEKLKFCPQTLICYGLPWRAIYNSIQSNYAFVGGFAERKTGVRRIIESQMIHPNYNQAKIRSDVCLVHLKKELPYGPNVQPICLPDADFALVDGEPMFIAGWGSKTVSGALQDTLHAVELPVVKFSKCEKQYGDAGLPLDGAVHYCAMTDGGGVGPCRGDWGAPAVVIRNGQPILAGMVSFGRGCGLDNFASVYVNLKTFTDWIVETGITMKPTPAPVITTVTTTTTTEAAMTTTTTSTTSTTTTTTTTTTTVRTTMAAGVAISSQCNPIWDTNFDDVSRREKVKIADRFDITKFSPMDILYEDDYGVWEESEPEQHNSIYASRLLGGTKVTNALSWPFAVSINGACGGSLIGKRWVLTAAHCCEPGVLDGAKIYIGTNSQAAATEDDIYHVAAYERHPSYNEYNYNNDVCIIQLDGDVEYSDRVRPICLEEDIESVFNIVGQSSFIAGWGQKSPNGQVKDLINEATVQVVERPECKMQFNQGWLRKAMYCVKGLESPVDTCHGDAGGPHVRIGNDGSAILQGVISFGGDCESKSEYSVVTDVARHMEFINHAIEQMEDTDEEEPFGSETPAEDTELLSSLVSVYNCPNPIDLFKYVRNPTVSASVEMPWVVVFHPNCQGVILGAEHVLTDAKCCPSQMRGFVINAGLGTPFREHSTVWAVERRQDLCLIQLQSPFKLSEAVQPICLEHTVEEAVDNADHTMYIKSQTGTELSMVGVTMEECDAIKVKSSMDKVTNNRFCGKGDDDRLCDLAPGSPVVRLGADGYPIVVGIMHLIHDMNCDANGSNYPLISDIFVHKQWIKETTRRMSGYVEKKYVTQTSAEQAAALQTFKDSDIHCVSPFDNISRFLFASDRVVGGFEVEEMSRWNFIGNLGGTCTVTLIGRHWALTAGHCCPAGVLNQQVQFGTANKFGMGGIRKDIKNFYVHPDYNTQTYANDICILELASDLTYDETIRPVCLETADVRESVADNVHNAFIAGFGSIEQGGETSNPLHEATVLIIDTDDCRKSHGETSIFEGQICAGYSDGGIDTCDGDSGGPLIVMDENNQKRLAGIVSWSQGCGRPGKPGVYTKVSHYAGWVFEVISDTEIDQPDQVVETTPEPEPQDEPEEPTLPEVDLEKESMLSTVVSDYFCASPYDDSLRSIDNYIQIALAFGEKYDTTTIDQWPFAANMQKGCSGVIIARDAILTSAFCCSRVPRSEVANWRINMGGSKATGNFRVRMKSVHMHPSYRNINGRKSNDICVIKIIRPMDYSDELQPACMADTMPPANTVLYTAGWPSKHGGAKKNAKIIMEEVASLESDDRCRHLYFGMVNDDHKCMSMPFNPSTVKTPCSRDVGAPVVMVDESGRPKLVGIMTKHRNCLNTAVDKTLHNQAVFTS